MALPNIVQEFTTLPTFNEFDTQMRTQWSRVRDRNIKDSYRAWGDESLVPLWANFLVDSKEKGAQLPDKTLRCLHLMGLDDIVLSGVLIDNEDELYPVPVAVFKQD